MDPTKIATLLLASVMAAGGVITIWSATLTEKVLPEGGNKSHELCSVAMFGIYSGDYDENSKSLY